MSVSIEDHATVADVMRQYPPARHAFERLGIDYCCGGKALVKDAAALKGLDVAQVIAAVEQALATPPAASEADRDWSKASPAELVDYVERRHHAFARKELERLEALLERVLAAHRLVHGSMLGSLRAVFQGMRTEIELHLQMEEQTIFPLIRRMAAPDAKVKEPRPAADCGSALENPIRQMEQEHEQLAASLDEILELTGSYALPPDACESFTALYEGLKGLEADLHEHVFLENTFLWPAKSRKPL